MKQRIYQEDQRWEVEAEAIDNVSKLDTFARNFERGLLDAMRLTNESRQEIARKAFELVEEAGLDPAKIAPLDAWLAFRAAAKGGGVYKQAMLNVQNIRAFGDLRLCFVAAGAV